MTKKIIQRFRRIGASMAVCVVALVFMVLVSACAGVAGNTTSVTGSVLSINAQQHSVSLKFNGQTITVNGLTDQEVALLQAQSSKISSISLQATQNSNGSYTISAGQNSVTITFTSGGSSTFNSDGTPEANNNETPGATETPNTNEPQGQNEPGSISFIGTVKSVGNSSIVVSLPDGSTLPMSIVNGQTDLSDFNGALPGVNQLIKVDATANADGSFLASQLKSTDSSDAQDQNTVEFDGVTTSAVGSDHALHFKVGNKALNFTIGSGTDLGDFNGNAQSIGNNVAVKVKVQFQGNTATVTKVSNANS